MSPWPLVVQNLTFLLFLTFFLSGDLYRLGAVCLQFQSFSSHDVLAWDRTLAIAIQVHGVLLKKSET
jgi:hypothetical protein